MALENAAVLDRVRSQFSSRIVDAKEYRGDLSIWLQPAALPDVAAFLREDPELQYILLSSVTGVDYLGRQPRFEVVYHFTSLVHGHRLVLKIGADENDPHVPSIARQFPTATFQEREVYDMFGIVFDGHPDLQRILMPEDWDGFPQRKTEPLVYEEVAFTFNHNEVDSQKPYAED
jgi:NADH-quinone oxidoreductase subunit C